MNTATLATVHRMQRPDAVRFNLRLLEKIARSHYQFQPKEAPPWLEMKTFAARLVRDAEAGNLSHTDSLILGAYGVAILRECAS